MNNIELKTEKQLLKHLIMNEVTWQQVRNMLGEERSSPSEGRGSPQIVVFCFYVHFILEPWPTCKCEVRAARPDMSDGGRRAAKQE